MFIALAQGIKLAETTPERFKRVSELAQTAMDKLDALAQQAAGDAPAGESSSMGTVGIVIGIIAAAVVLGLIIKTTILDKKSE